MRRRLFSIAAGKTSVKTDSLFNIPNSILSKINSNLYLTENHPLNKLKNRIEARFPTYSKIDNLSNPIVSVQRNFNDLLIPSDHPGRLPSDTYYFNKDTVLRTHTSAHQSDILSSKLNNKYLITADVYRRDEIDPTHYPVFHQMEGIHTFSRSNLALEIKDDAVVDESDIKLKIVDETGDGVIQTNHSIEESQMVSNHMKKTLESLIKNLFSREKELEIRWIEAYFPFTSPSWEMEVFYDGKWLEVFGCGYIDVNLENSNQIGWAFGLGLERIAMVLYGIPDIRLFWSQDPRFTSQFATKESNITFKPFSKYPACYKDVSFWCKESIVHDNDICDLVREIAGDNVEKVDLIDEFNHPKKGTSKCYRIIYRSMDKTLSNAEVNDTQEIVRKTIAERLKVDLRE